MGKRKSLSLLLSGVALGLFLVSGCEKKPSMGTVDPDRIQQTAAQHTELERIFYSLEQMDQIMEAIEEAPVKYAHLPTLAAGDDPFTTVKASKNLIVLQYNEMRISLSSSGPFEPIDDKDEITEVVLANGAKGEWIHGDVQLPSHHFFRFQLGDLYVKIDDSRQLEDDRHLSEAQIIKIAESFVPIGTKYAEVQNSTTIEYTKEQKAQAHELLSKLGINKAWVPMRGISSDAVTTISEEQGAVVINYPNFNIRLSPNSLDYANRKVIKEIRLQSGQARWMGVGEAADLLVLKKESMYIAISTDKAFNEKALESVADSLLPLEASVSGEVPVTAEYMFALRSVNEFLAAWLTRDWQAGMKLVTDDFKKKADEGRLQAFFVGVSNPHHQAFEVTGSRRIDDLNFEFQLWLYEYYTGEPDNGLPAERGKGITVTATKVGTNDLQEGIWKVSHIPY